VPIKAQGAVLGVLNVTDRRSGRPFDEADLSYLSSLSGQVAVAIESARNFEKLQAAYESVKSAQEKLVASEKIKALGQMAAGVAHDFNNALTVIMGKAQIGVDRIADGTVDSETLRANLETIIRVSSKGAERIKRIQDYTRIRKDVPDGPVDINSVIREALELTRPKWNEESKAQGRSIDVRIELTDVPPVCGNVYELTQVMENLIFNAAEAMPQGGELTFKTYAEGNSIVLQVSDTGIGMSEESQGRVFEPFFTTKEDGQGLGSSIIYGIVERHGGEIAVDSKPGEGSTFTVRLPRPQAISLGAGRPAVQAADAERTVRILLVDDDELVLETYQEGLSLKGHQVVVAHNGSEALLALNKGGFDVMITDLSMSGMAGLELAERAKKIAPALPIILLSGWAIQHAEKQIKQVGIDYVVSKPCSIEALGNIIQEAIRAGVLSPIG
jgi:signal transduction histidine kinase/ActR/RegA family two-component response regulator